MAEDRRTFLKLAAAGLAAPLLPLMGQGQAGDAKPPLRFLTLVDAFGLSGDHSEPWIRSGTGDYELAEGDLGWVLDPLAAFRENMLVVSGLTMQSRDVVGGGAAHFSINSHTLTGSRGQGGRASGLIHAHPSVDVHIGEFINQEYGLFTPRIYPHLAIGHPYYLYSYGSDGNPAEVLSSPEAVFSSVFGASDGVGLAARSAVLDQVRAQLQEIRPQLIHANKSTVLDAYESSVQAVAREVELRRDLVCDPGTRDTWPGAGSAAGIEAMFDALYHMFACDLVSSVTLNLHALMRHNFLRGDAFVEGDADVQTIISRAYHNSSHNNTPVGARTQGIVNRWRNGFLAQLLERLAETPDVDGTSTILDNTVVCFTSAMSHNTHKTNEPYPTFLIGGRNTNLRGGWHVDASGRSNNDFLTTLAQTVTAPTPRFGGYNGALAYRGESLNTGPIEEMLLETF